MAKNKQKKKTSYSTYLKDFLLACGGVSLVIIGGSFLLFKGTTVQGYGMTPTIHNGDVVIAKRTKKFKRFDVLVLKQGAKKQVCRVIGFSGETVRYQNDVLWINDEPVDEKFIVDEINETQSHGKAYTDDFVSGEISGSRTIPEGYCFVLGDNRPYATDSRHTGLIAMRNIEGVVVLRVLPVNDFRVF